MSLLITYFAFFASMLYLFPNRKKRRPQYIDWNDNNNMITNQTNLSITPIDTSPIIFFTLTSGIFNSAYSTSLKTIKCELPKKKTNSEIIIINPLCSNIKLRFEYK